MGVSRDFGMALCLLPGCRAGPPAPPGGNVGRGGRAAGATWANLARRVADVVTFRLPPKGKLAPGRRATRK